MLPPTLRVLRPELANTVSFLIWKASAKNKSHSGSNQTRCLLDFLCKSKCIFCCLAALPLPPQILASLLSPEPTDFIMRRWHNFSLTPDECGLEGAVRLLELAKIQVDAYKHCFKVTSKGRQYLLQLTDHPAAFLQDVVEASPKSLKVAACSFCL